MKINNEQLSLAIKSIRYFLFEKNFFETHLYSMINYKIENTRTFQLRENVFLRYNPEPDIWKIGQKYDNFFWIGSIFRDEPLLSEIHSYEFTLVDIYEIGNKENVKKRLIELLTRLENDLNLKPLSRKIIEIDYNDEKDLIQEKECWILVKNYPNNKSFYDKSLDNKRTEKFEFFYKNNSSITEIVACGKLGENINSNKYIKNENKIVLKEPLNKGFIGFGIGLERLLLLYSIKQK